MDNYTFVVFVGIAKCNSVHATINNNTRVTAPTVRIIAEDFTRNIFDLGNNFVSALRNTEGPYFRCSFYTVVNSKAFGTNRNVRYIVCVRFSEVSGVGGSTASEVVNLHSVKMRFKVS